MTQPAAKPRLEIVRYNPNWVDEFRQLAMPMRQALGELALRIDHIGSTSVPGLDSKDVIDIQVTVRALDDQVLHAFESIGYRLKSHTRDHIPPSALSKNIQGCYPDLTQQDWDKNWEKWYFAAPEGQRRTHTHVRLPGRLNQRYPLLFRDYLRCHAASARAYAELKHRLAAELSDSNTYAEVKDPAVDLIYLAAEEWAEQVGWSPGASDA